MLSGAGLTNSASDELSTVFCEQLQRHRPIAAAVVSEIILSFINFVPPKELFYTIILTYDPATVNKYKVTA